MDKLYMDFELEHGNRISKKKAFGKKMVICMICLKKMQLLTPHLKWAHGLTADDYRARFGIEKKQPLCSKNYSEMRRRIVREWNRNMLTTFNSDTLREMFNKASESKTRRR